MKRFATVVYNINDHMIANVYRYDTDSNLLECVGFENYTVSVGYRDTLMYSFLVEIEKMINKYGFTVDRISLKYRYKESFMEELEYFPIVKNNVKNIY